MSIRSGLRKQRLLVLQYGIEPWASLRRDKGLGKHVLRNVCDYIEAKLGGRLTLDDLARLAGLSPFHFVRCFKTSTGLPPHKYVLARRMELAKSLLVTTTQPVQEIVWSVGYENISHFRRKFRAEIGLSPGELRKAIQN